MPDLVAMFPSSLDPLALAWFAVEWVIRIAMLIVVPFRRSSDAARGWLLIVFFLPVPALILYLLIGRPSYPRWRRRRFAEASRLLSYATEEISHTGHCCQPVLPDYLAPAAQLIEHLGQFPALGGNTVALLPDYEGVVDRLVTDIDRARHHVHLLTYIFADDVIGQRIMDALQRAVARGVACRVLIDAVGSRRWASALHRRLSQGGVEVACALPVLLLGKRSMRADLRNHRKIAVIDAEVGYIGSQNIIAADFVPGLVNQELMVRVTGPAVLEFQAVFMSDWFLETGQALNAPEFFPHCHAHGNVIAQLLPSGPDYPVAGVESMVVALIHGARQRVVITTPYFIPDKAFLQALQTAVLRGTEVHLILSQTTDHALVSLAQQSYYDELLSAGGAIHLFREGLLHAKHLSIDESISVIGSSNIDIRSFLLNAEASLIIYDETVTAGLRSEQRRTLAASDRLVRAQWDRRSLLKKQAENIARLVSPLI